MNTKPEFVFPRQDYSEDQLYSKLTPGLKQWKQKDCQGGMFSDSEVGGEAQDQQNPWQGSQERWEQL